ncbi:MAG TPA: M14 family zinc carboxypeptidase [Gemmatimonadota bacterium]|nr:M14 family zinc carboxypeptidase [Gemmatimonadota bacterium]
MSESRGLAALSAGALSKIVALAVLAVPAAPPAGLAAQPVPAPSDVLGYDPVVSERLPGWGEITSYFEALAVASPRVRLDTIGRTTLDAPLIVATVSDETNLDRLDELREVQRRLADPRRIESDEERAALIRRGRLVALVTAGVHSTEVGGPITAMRLAHHLASSTSPQAGRIRREVIVLIVPALNPDGIDPVKEWYESTVGTPWLGSEPPFLYHHYVGHDLNRDWYAFTQKETRLLVERVHQVWFPQIHHDMHQHEATGARYFVPPWLDPVEPNIDPLLIAAATSLGTRTQWTMLEEGKSGVSVAARYDAWSPSRSYAHYHAGVRILSETASARLAAPIELGPEDLVPTAGLDPRASSWNHPVPWPGGRWTLRDIVDYMETGALAMLGIAAAEREVWLGNFAAVGRRAVAGWDSWPEAWVIPASPGRDAAAGLDAAAVAELVRILLTAGVELRRTDEAFELNGRRFEAGSYVIDMHQPYAAFGQALLAPQPYPERRGSSVPPYDVTAHNLPLLLGVDAVPAYEAPEATGDLLKASPPAPSRHIEGLSGERSVMVGLYRPWIPTPDEGWTRWLFDNYAVPYASLTNDDIASGGLLREFTAVAIPSIPGAHLRDGRSAADVPPRYAGGLGARHVANLQAFVDGGGTLVAWGASVDFVIDALELPVENVLANLPAAEFSGPGAQVALEIDTTTTLGRSLAPRTSAFLLDGAAFRGSDDGDVSVHARYGGMPVTLSGRVVGESWIAGRSALIEVRRGAGRVVLFGFPPQYRGQSMATWPLLFNALKRR